jgi:beta-lactamase regulating signal transducer with metallopeptidase domain
MQQRLRILHTEHPVACTVGFWQPQIVLSAGLLTVLSSAEVRAVLGHEWGHVSRRDPLRLLLLRFWSSTLWFLPIVRALARDSAHSMEEAADDAAVFLTDQPLDLAAALVKTAKAQAQPRWSPLPALGGEHTVSVRVQRLLEVTPTRHRQRHYRVWATSTVVAMFLLGALLLPRHPGAAAVSVAPIPAQQPMMACPMPLAQG